MNVLPTTGNTMKVLVKLFAATTDNQTQFSFPHSVYSGYILKKVTLRVS